MQQTDPPTDTIESPTKKQKKSLLVLEDCRDIIVKMHIFDKIEYRIVNWIKWWEQWILCAVEKYDSLTIELDKDIPTDSNVWEDDVDMDYWPECLNRLLRFHCQLDITEPEYEKITVVEIKFDSTWNDWLTRHYKKLGGTVK
jgi:hypothetical protein